jgi:hypothetical protein
MPAVTGRLVSAPNSEVRMRILILLVFFAVFLTGCESPNDTDQSPGVLNVTVTDEQGNPLPDVSVYYAFLFDELSAAVRVQAPQDSQLVLNQNYPNPFNPQTAIAVFVPVSTQINLFILMPDYSDTLRTLYNGYAQSGQYIFTWDGRDDRGRNLPNGLYPYVLLNGDFRDEKRACLNMRDPHYIREIDAIPNLITDGAGKFSLAYDEFQVGTSVTQTGIVGQMEQQITISDSMELYLIREGYQTTTVATYLPETGTKQVGIVMSDVPTP